MQLYIVYGYEAGELCCYIGLFICVFRTRDVMCGPHQHQLGLGTGGRALVYVSPRAPFGVVVCVSLSVAVCV